MHLLDTPLTLLLPLLPLLLLSPACGQAPAMGTVHTVITTECGGYFSWQTLGLVYSHRKSGQPGPLTRLLSCTEEQLKDQKVSMLYPWPSGFDCPLSCIPAPVHERVSDCCPATQRE